jgi:hypothetical protein
MLWEPGAERFTLVHGRVRQMKGCGDWIDHAWIDLNDGRVYDVVHDEYIPADEYAASCGAVADRRYSREAAMRRIMMRRGHAGPWHQAA